MTDETEQLVDEWIDPSNNLMWQTVVYRNHPVEGGTMTGRLHRAVCRPESCAEGHRCGRLEIGIIT